jgi:hypothetical protein
MIIDKPGFYNCEVEGHPAMITDEAVGEATLAALKTGILIAPATVRVALETIAPDLIATGMERAAEIAEKTLKEAYADDSPLDAIEAIRNAASQLREGKG